MRITKMELGMGQTVSKNGNPEFENYKPHVNIEIEVLEGDDINDCKQFLKEHVEMFQAQVERDIQARIIGSGGKQWGKPHPERSLPPMQFSPYGPFQAQRVPAPPTMPVRAPFTPQPLTMAAPPQVFSQPQSAAPKTQDLEETIFEGDDEVDFRESWED